MKKGYDYMHTDNTIKFNFWQEIPVKAAVSALAGLRVGFERIRQSRQARVASWVILAVLVLTLEWMIAARVEQRKALESFEAWKVRFADDYISMQEAKEIGLPPDPKELLAEQEIGMIARALYGVKSNSDADLHKYCWCFFNRVDIKSGEFRDVENLEEVFAKPGQFMGYSENNPVLDRLRDIASEEYSVWRNGKSRPYDVEYVFTYWTPEKILLLKEMGDIIHGV